MSHWFPALCVLCFVLSCSQAEGAPTLPPLPPGAAGPASEVDAQFLPTTEAFPNPLKGLRIDVGGNHEFATLYRHDNRWNEI